MDKLTEYSSARFPDGRSAERPVHACFFLRHDYNRAASRTK